VAGNVVSFVHSGEQEVGYWIAKKYWGRGVATRALAESLRLEARRPLYANVARHNVASIRVLEDCGFRISGEELEDLTLELVADETDHSRAAERSAGAKLESEGRVYRKRRSGPREPSRHQTAGCRVDNYPPPGLVVPEEQDGSQAVPTTSPRRPRSGRPPASPSFPGEPYRPRPSRSAEAAAACSSRPPLPERGLDLPGAF
jgi:Acetyltransferase (GNAT) domain